MSIDCTKVLFCNLWSYNLSQNKLVDGIRKNVNVKLTSKYYHIIKRIFSHLMKSYEIERPTVEGFTKESHIIWELDLIFDSFIEWTIISQDYLSSDEDGN